MAAELINEGIGALSGGGIVGGVVALATTLGWWLRRERVESAKSNNSVAANNASTHTYEAQSKEIKEVRERLQQMETAYVAQSVQMNVLIKKISELEAKLVGVASHHGNLILCDTCMHTNQRVLHALNKALKPLIEIPPEEKEINDGSNT